MIEINVGANSKITDCRVAKPTKYFGIKGLLMFKAVCIATYEKEMKHTIPNEPMIKSSISLKIRFLSIDHLVILLNTLFNIKK
jgi:hypothetical protein